MTDLLFYTHVELAPELRKAFESYDLSQGLPLVAGRSGQVIVKEADRQVLRLDLPGWQFPAYLKWTRGARLSQMLRMMLRLCRPGSAAIRELKLLQRLREANLPAAKPLGWGEHRVLGIPRSGFLITQAIPGNDLEQTLDSCDEKHRRLLWKKLGKLLGALHRNGFYHTVRTKDLIVADRVPDDEHRWQAGGLVLIDREATYPRPKRFSIRRSAQALARCLAKYQRAGQTLTAAEIRLFWRGYGPALTQGRKLSLRQLITQVEAALARIQRHPRYVKAARTLPAR